MRPVWEPGREYRWLQRLEATVRVAGLGKQTMDWRQHFHCEPNKASTHLDLMIDRVRVDLDIGGKRSRYYFDPVMPLRFQERRGIQGLFLSHTEQHVRNRYRIDLADDAVSPFVILDRNGRKRQPKREGWSQLPWDVLSAAVLHQGIPDTPMEKEDTWEIIRPIVVEPHGRADWTTRNTFVGFQQHEGRELALIRYRGELSGQFFQDMRVANSPGIAIHLSKLRGLTLIDSSTRQIVSTVVKLDGKLTSLGLPGTAEKETAPIKSTLTLTLLEAE